MSFKEKMDILNQMFSFSYILTPIFAVLAIIQPHASAFWLAFMVLTQLPSFLYIVGYSRHNKPQSVSWIKWVTQLYLAFFVMSTFINWVSTKAVFNYVTRRSQGWKPTGKTAEAYISWKAAISSRKGLFTFAIAGLTLFTAMVSHLTSANALTTNELVFMSPSVLFFLNMALVVMVFGRSRMQEQGNITMMSIENDYQYQQSTLNTQSGPLKKAS